MIKNIKNNDMKSYAEKLKVYTYYSYISLIAWILSGVILAVLLITDITLPIWKHWKFHTLKSWVRSFYVISA